MLMDNIAFHHSKEVVKVIQDRGWSKLHTLPYSPSLNPIEYVFRSCKACYRENAPPENDDAFDYFELLVRVVLGRADCDAPFRKVNLTVHDALKSGGQNFSGYDLRSARRRCVDGGTRVTMTQGFDNPLCPRIPRDAPHGGASRGVEGGSDQCQA